MIRFEQADRESLLDEPYPVRTVVEMEDGCAFDALLRAFCYFALALGYQPGNIAEVLSHDMAEDMGFEVPK